MRLLPLFAVIFSFGCASTTAAPDPSDIPQTAPSAVITYAPMSMASKAAFEKTFPNWKDLYRQGPIEKLPSPHNELPKMEGGVMFTSLYLDIEGVEETAETAEGEELPPPGKETLSFETYQKRITVEELIGTKETLLPGTIGLNLNSRKRYWEAAADPSYGFSIQAKEDKEKIKPVFESLKGRIVFAYEGHTGHTGANCVFGAPKKDAASTPVSERSPEQLWVVVCHSNPRM